VTGTPSSVKLNRAVSSGAPNGSPRSAGVAADQS
jgi:hypothetical protein